MRQLTCTAPGVLEWRDVDDPGLAGSDAALIRPIAVARCDLDPLLIARGPAAGQGFAVGHEAIAEVLAVTDDMAGIAVGDLVACSFQLSCGRCGMCRAGHTAACESYPILSDYGMQPLSQTEYGGMLSDVVLVPHASAMLFRIPDGSEPTEIASAADNIADGYRAVAAPLGERPGADVLIVCHGGRSIALYAALAAVALGADTVTFESDDAEALDIASSLGANAVRTDFGRRAGRWPIVVECGNRTDALQHAVESTEPEGIFHSLSYYPDAMTPLPLGKLYTRGIRFYTGRVHSAAMLPAVLDVIASGRLVPGAIPRTVIGWESAPSRYIEPAIKVVVAR